MVLNCGREAAAVPISEGLKTAWEWEKLKFKKFSSLPLTFTPAAAETMKWYFDDTGTKPQEYDAIFTGDLGEVGSSCLYDLMNEYGYDIQVKHKDCGLMLFDKDSQDVHAGGSGCGCAASVLCSTVLPDLKSGSRKMNSSVKSRQ